MKLILTVKAKGLLDLVAIAALGVEDLEKEASVRGARANCLGDDWRGTFDYEIRLERGEKICMACRGLGLRLENDGLPCESGLSCVVCMGAGVVRKAKVKGEEK